MGYRSEVKSVIYGTPEAVDNFMTNCEFELDQLKEDFGDEIKIILSDSRKFIFLACDYTKWYDSYAHVQHWHELLVLANDAKLSTEFVRAGEDSEGDIEQEYNGVDNMCYLSPVITIDVGFSYDNTVKGL